MAINITTNIGKYKNYFQDIRIFYEQRQDVKIFLEILLSLATIILFSIFAIRPTLLTIGQLLTEIQNKEVTVAKLNEKIENLKTAQVVYESSGGVLSLLDTAIPSETEIEKEAYQQSIKTILHKHNNLLNVKIKTIHVITMINIHNVNC